MTELEQIREILLRPPVVDRSQEIADLYATIATLRHRLRAREFENSSLYAKIELLKLELLQAQEGEPRATR